MAFHFFRPRLSFFSAYTHKTRAVTHRRTIEAFIFFLSRGFSFPARGFHFFPHPTIRDHGVQPGGFNVSLPLADFIFSRIKNNLDHNTIHSHRNCLSTRGGTARTKGRVVLHSDSAYRPATRRVPSTQPHLSMEDGTDPEGLRSNQSIGRRTNRDYLHTIKNEGGELFFKEG